jgi:tetratricopeptide (TPR) repeat protein
MMHRRIALVVLLLLAACAAHEKAGDRAAASGDWKTAERAYAEALRKDPDKKELQDKYRQARTAAVDDATRRAQACSAGRDWECAFSESGYVLRLDPGSAPMAALHADAAREVAFLRVQRAQEAGDRGDWLGGLDLLRQAREASSDPGVAAEIRRATPALVRGAAAEADRLRAARQYPQAIQLLELASAADPAQRARLDATRAEYERWKDGEAERLTDEGEARLAQRRFADAKQSFDAALQLRPQCRAQPLARYAGRMAEAQAAVGRRDFAGAERALDLALQDGVDRPFVQGELDRVRVRPYAIRLRSVLVQPLRPDGWPWAGGRSRDLDRVVARLAGFDPQDAASGLALDLARRLPAENQPTLAVTVVLPDGRTLRAAPRRGVYALLDGSVVVLSNGFDDRVLAVRVEHELGGGARPMMIGEVPLKLGELVTGGSVAVGGQSVLQLRVEVDPADAPEGTFSGLQPVADAGNLAEAWSVPARASKGYRVLQVDASAPPPAPGATATAQLAVEVEQHGRVVFRTPVAPRAPASWSPPATYLFIDGGEALQVKLVDRGARNAVLLSEPVAAAALDRGTTDLRNAAGASVRLRVEPRRAGPGSAPTAAR